MPLELNNRNQAAESNDAGSLRDLSANTVFLRKPRLGLFRGGFVESQQPCSVRVTHGENLGQCPNVTYRVGAGLKPAPTCVYFRYGELYATVLGVTASPSLGHVTAVDGHGVAGDE